MGDIERLQQQINDLRRMADKAYRSEYDTTRYLTAPLTSTSWDGDAYSTTAKTKIDLSAVFGVPAGVRAVLVRIQARDSAGAGTTGLFLGLSPNDTAGSLAIAARASGLPNDYYAEQQGFCPCDANGDVYYQIGASGAGTLDAIMQIWGYVF